MRSSATSSTRGARREGGKEELRLNIATVRGCNRCSSRCGERQEASWDRGVYLVVLVVVSGGGGPLEHDGVGGHDVEACGPMHEMRWGMV